MRTGVEAAAYAAELRRIMLFFGITDGNMQACVRPPETVLLALSTHAASSAAELGESVHVFLTLLRNLCFEQEIPAESMFYLVRLYLCCTKPPHAAVGTTGRMGPCAAT